ncbi:LOW QUALITY PROTEIN: uncharacterized protein [Castor canadensis]|uniref:LOW QUALITY PROTEIN: uncharacterized protein n=1 Tax=Castor canadensis TaxID=51338 RepID=A0AC58KJN4_CASCN
MDRGPQPLVGTPQLAWRRTLQSAPNLFQLPLSAISLLLRLQRAGTEQAVATCTRSGRPAPGTPEGSQANGKRAEVHTPTPKPHSIYLPGGGSSAQGTDAPGPAACTLTARPHPQSFRRPSAHPPGRGSGRVPRGQLEQQAWEPRSSHLLAPEGSVASLLPSAKRAPGPAPPACEEAAAGAGGRRGAERLAARRSTQQPPLGRLLLRSPGEVSLAPSLARSVRASVGPRGPPSPAVAVAVAAAAAAAAAAPAPARHRVPSRLAAPLAGSRAPSLARCPRRCRRRAERSRAGHRLPLPRSLSRAGGGGAARAGRRGESGGGGEAAPSAPYRSPLAERPQAGPESAEPPGSRGRGGGPGASPREGAQGEGGEWRNPRVCLEVVECADAGVSVCAGKGGHWADPALWSLLEAHRSSRLGASTQDEEQEVGVRPQGEVSHPDCHPQWGGSRPDAREAGGSVPR